MSEQKPSDRKLGIRLLVAATVFAVLAIPHTVALHRNIRLALAAILAAVAIYYLRRPTTPHDSL